MRGIILKSTVLIPVSIAVLLHAPSAWGDDCQAVADAYDALSKVPVYHQTVMMKGKLLMEAIIVGDVLYSKNDATWQKMPLGPGMRVQMQKRVVPDAASLKGCARVGTETVAGRATTLYDYTPPAVEGAGELGPQRVWIDDAKGLPVKMTSEVAKIAVTLDFDNVVAPLP